MKKKNEQLKKNEQQKKAKDFEFAKELVTPQDEKFSKTVRPEYEVYPGE